MKQYADDKPKDCKFCYWGTKKSECTRYECYYLIKEKKKPRYKCKDDCPYGSHWPCIGWCTRKILEEKGN